jgi:hypothetical protein
LATASCDLWQNEHLRTSSEPERDLTIPLLSQNRAAVVQQPVGYNALILRSGV